VTAERLDSPERKDDNYKNMAKAIIAQDNTVVTVKIAEGEVAMPVDAVIPTHPTTGRLSIVSFSKFKELSGLKGNAAKRAHAAVDKAARRKMNAATATLMNEGMGVSAMKPTVRDGKVVRWDVSLTEAKKAPVAKRRGRKVGTKVSKKPTLKGAISMIKGLKGKARQDAIAELVDAL
jgi:hypothetical protein